MGYRNNQYNMPLIQVKQKEIENFMKLPNGINTFIEITKNDIDNFPMEGNFNELFNKLIVLLYAISNVAIKVKKANPDELYKYNKLLSFHNEYIYPRYMAMKEVIATSRLKYFAFYGKESESLKKAVLDDEL